MDEFLTSHKVMHATLSPQSAARVYQTFTGLASQSLLVEGLPA